MKIYNRKIKETFFLIFVKNENYKNKLLIVDFNDLFKKKDLVLSNICDFLNINFENSMREPHMISNKLII